MCACVVSKCVFVIRDRERERESEVKKHTFLLFIIVFCLFFGKTPGQSTELNIYGPYFN